MNTAHFDRKAAVWDDNPLRCKLAREIAGAIEGALPLASSFSAMEFGCGTGLISRALLASVGKIMAIDLSSKMIEQLQQRIRANGLMQIKACCLDILTDPPAGLFDLVFSAMVLHHVLQIDPLLDALAERVVPGGYLALADLDLEDGSFHGETVTSVHHGFDREELKAKLAARGFHDPVAVTVSDIHKNDHDYSVFLITAQKKNTRMNF